jgi:hypothetical protein
MNFVTQCICVFHMFIILDTDYVNRLHVLYCVSLYDSVFIFNYALQPFKAYCAIWIGLFNFRHQASPRVSPRESTQRRKVELWARNVR